MILSETVQSSVKITSVIFIYLTVICYRRSEKVNISGNGMDPALHQNKAFEDDTADPEQGTNIQNGNHDPGTSQTNGGH